MSLISASGLLRERNNKQQLNPTDLDVESSSDILTDTEPLFQEAMAALHIGGRPALP
jgi:hypothetical protein